MTVPLFRKGDRPLFLSGGWGRLGVLRTLLERGGSSSRHRQSARLSEFPADERPRERILLRGEESLSNGELLALILDSGLPGVNALDLARRVLGQFEGLRRLTRASWREITRVRGVGPAKAARIQAALALGRRAQPSLSDRAGPYLAARDVFDRLGARLAVKEQESFYALLLDSKNRLIREERISTGTLTASLVHPREVFRSAIRESAASVIVAHNHPSGDPSPSAEDLEVTARLRSAGELIGIPLLDHVIIGTGRYTSLAEEGRLSARDRRTRRSS